MGDADTASDADTSTDASTSETHQEPDGNLGTDSGPREQSESVAPADTNTSSDISSKRVRDANAGLDLNPISDSDSAVDSGERPSPDGEASSAIVSGVDSASDTGVAAGPDGNRDTVERSQFGGSRNTDTSETANPQHGTSGSLVDSADSSDFIFIGNFDTDDDSGFTVDLERDRDTESPPGAGSHNRTETTKTTETGESPTDDSFARLQTSHTFDEGQEVPARDREEVFSQLDADADSVSQLDSTGPIEEDPFEEVGIDAIDPETVRDGLGLDGEPEPSSETQPVDTAGDSDHVISKRQYCQQCPHFSGPPATVCEHSGTTIVSVVEPGKFRVRNCPIVGENTEETDQTP